MESSNGILPKLSPPEALIYWIKERWAILQAREAGLGKPWSQDPVFQSTYFCNVRRENDTVTKWIRNQWGQYQSEENYELAMILARFVNWPETLNYIGFPFTFNPEHIEKCIDERMAMGAKTWGNAYVITTHGLPMGKAAYLAKNVLQGAYRSLQAIRQATRSPAIGGTYPTLEGAYNALIKLEGLGSFLAAQVVADLKNTRGHPLGLADDWWDWSAPGPGSLRGMSWFFYNMPDVLTKSQYEGGMKKIRAYVDSQLGHNISFKGAEVVFDNVMPKFCNQDLQNCLCEFDKYMRVKNGTGKSKRNYNGVN